MGFSTPRAGSGPRHLLLAPFGDTQLVSPPLVWHGIWSAGAGRSVPEDGGSVGFGRGHRPRPPHPLTTIASAHIAASHSHPYLERLRLHQRQGAPEDLVPPPSPPCRAGEPGRVPALVLRSSTGGWDPSLPRDLPGDSSRDQNLATRAQPWCAGARARTAQGHPRRHREGRRGRERRHRTADRLREG